MAYSTGNPPAKILDHIGNTSRSLWYYSDADPFATMLATGYFTDGGGALEVGDSIILVDETTGASKLGYVSVSTAGGAATVVIQEFQANKIIAPSAATRTLTAAESGSFCLFNRAAGLVYTLPAPIVGLEFTFMNTKAITSNAESVVTDAATTFMVGVIQQVIAASATSEGQVADGTTHVGYSANGSTTGGLVGSWTRVKCITATKWAIWGIHVGSGTLATPFTT